MAQARKALAVCNDMVLYLWHRRDGAGYRSWPADCVPAHWVSRQRNTTDRVEYAAYAQTRLVARLASWRNEAGMVHIGMRVRSDERGRGRGRIAVQLLSNWLLQQHSYDMVLLEVSEDNIAALRCYNAAGFVERGAVHRDGHQFVVMGKR